MYLTYVFDGNSHMLKMVFILWQGLWHQKAWYWPSLHLPSLESEGLTMITMNSLI